jgi:acyl-CoA thioester hydrolase
MEKRDAFHAGAVYGERHCYNERMSTEPAPAAPVFREDIIVPAGAIDANGHVNNVVFVQWMQDVATRHFKSTGCAELMRAMGATWVVRSHTIEYLASAFADDRLNVSTWVVNFSRVRSLRHYRFARASDGKVLVRGETDWVFVNTKTGRPCSIPEVIQKSFVLVTDNS